ncbi:hypothetical protein M569_00735, partial [Genlisea aurea]
ASKEIASVEFQVDKLTKQVSAIEIEMQCGRKVGEIQVKNLIESSMNQLIKLDSIAASGELKSQRRMLVKRVQECIESLD